MQQTNNSGSEPNRCVAPKKALLIAICHFHCSICFLLKQFLQRWPSDSDTHKLQAAAAAVDREGRALPMASQSFDEESLSLCVVGSRRLGKMVYVSY